MKERWTFHSFIPDNPATETRGKEEHFLLSHGVVGLQIMKFSLKKH